LDIVRLLFILLQNVEGHPFGSLRVRFEGEEGTGPGVNRGLFAAFANALKSGQKVSVFVNVAFRKNHL